MRSWSPYALLAVIAIALDQWVKHLVETGLPFQEKLDLLPFLALFRTYNTGIAFSMFSSLGDTGLVVIAMVVVAFVLYLATHTPSGHVIARTGFALIIGGALGNLIDRAVYGHVIDYILFHTPVWSFAVFNLADALISVGAALVVFDELIGWRREPKSSNAKPSDAKPSNAKPSKD
ncbi:signal peptidase II [Mesorhizobium opportunistum]|uniref:Lipoprotein signal peptidase n=1 Tax=Mesorhizobium opportunistum TaxID=593909 RepID=A0ABV1Y920_9HYPH|nr:signal peptidase II [Mesorhizobium sp.]TIN98456.1 MAG: signal peptidase II [Mesorhizobium sp.]TJU99045.1 MAG: signal peptidase II [Mesorhizobium sp.]TJV15225.1 MAG: signal peptidase II [Mesorhizobium sp.]